MINDKPIRLVHELMLVVEKCLLSKFSKIIFLDAPIKTEVATLLVMNHFSFNDGPMMHFLCRRVLKRV
ncbi:hypothetical protein [Pedobacter sp. ASV12]|uniref:hypothetical protein n=1 Tax=Pedobacter sp. ASV12 TaxID=2795120 RepID=UPI0018ED4E98|nr:hypothetical protein [Pedobacter sp. ASV12]